MHLSVIDDAAIGVDLLEVAMGVHVGGLRGWVQPEALAAPQHDVQVVVEVVMEATASACYHTHISTGLTVYQGWTMETPIAPITPSHQLRQVTNCAKSPSAPRHPVRQVNKCAKPTSTPGQQVCQATTCAKSPSAQSHQGKRDTRCGSSRCTATHFSKTRKIDIMRRPVVIVTRDAANVGEWVGVMTV